MRTPTNVSPRPAVTPSDIEIAQAAKIRPIVSIAARLGIPQDSLDLYGPYKAKIRLDQLKKGRKGDGKLILVSAMTPSPAGEGKTTVTVGLGQALARLGEKAAIALREPSLGPCMGIKGGAAGGGYSQVIPMEDINLHFTGDIHAVGSAHNLLAAIVDNHIYQGNPLHIDPRRVLWGRVMDMNDRSLRQIVIGLGGALEGVPRETGFDITVASEIMAILCLCSNFTELKTRLGDILLGFTYDKKPVYARDLHLQGAMAALLKEAIKPNLVQTLEGVPAFIHGGPFANIAHGTNSVLATRMALRFADYAVTEAGFGFDLGGEKFLNIKCRSAQLQPACVVLVATTRALKLHGGVPLADVHKRNLEALKEGMCNLEKHIESCNRFKLPMVVAINRFTYDTLRELEFVRRWLSERSVRSTICNVWKEGGRGGEDLAREVIDLTRGPTRPFTPLYDWNASIEEKLDTIAREIYGAREVDYQPRARMDLENIRRLGFDNLPICMAKTQYSLSDRPKLLGRPRDFSINVREITIASGARFLVPITGNIIRMPGLPRKPTAQAIDIDEGDQITGLF